MGLCLDLCSACPAICGQAVEPPTPCASCSKLTLQIMNAFAIIIMISAFVMGDFINGIMSIMFIFILFCCWRFLHYKLVVFYLLFCIFLFINSLALLLQQAQNAVDPFTGGWKTAWAAFQIIFCAYYFAASIICFFIYREFKAVYFQKNPSIHRFLQNRDSAMNDAPEPSNYAIDNEFAPNYGEPQIHPTSEQNQHRGQLLHVYQGKGVVIGGK